MSTNEQTAEIWEHERFILNNWCELVLKEDPSPHETHDGQKLFKKEEYKLTDEYLWCDNSDWKLNNDWIYSNSFTSKEWSKDPLNDSYCCRKRKYTRSYKKKTEEKKKFIN